MSSEFVGTGWRFPIFPDAAGGLTYSEGDQNVEQSLKILLLTNLGQRVMRPDFGSKAPSLVFAPGSVQYLSLVEDTIREAAFPLGLVDIKVCAVDEKWSGLKLVIRKENRI